MKRNVLFLLLALLLLAGCTPKGQIMDGPDMVNSYRQIDQESARQMMAQDDGHVIVDVRRFDEYESGHIPSAICIPNEEIGDGQPEELPDRKQIILIYCRSGRRSKEASEKLFIHKNTLQYRMKKLESALGIGGWPAFRKEYMIRILLEYYKEKQGLRTLL